MSQQQEDLQDSILSIVPGSNGTYFVNGIKAPRVTTGVLYVTGNIYTYGQFVNPLMFGGGIETNSVTSIDGDLVLNSATPNINLSGKTLTNVAGIVVNPNFTQAYGNLTTTNATPTTLISIPMAAGQSYLIQTTISGSNVTSGSDSVALMLSVRATCGALGAISLSPQFNTEISADVALSSCSATYTISGQNVIVVITGVAATTINWFGASQITRSLAF